MIWQAFMRDNKLFHNLVPSSGPERIHDLARLISGRVGAREIPAGHWADINQLAIRHGLGPLLWCILLQQDQQVCSTAVFQPLADSVNIASFNYQLLRESQSWVQAAFSQAGIPSVWFKGMALAQTHYPKPDLRPMDDQDVLVPFAQRQDALEALLALGYFFPPKDELEKRLGAPDRTAYHFHLRGGPSGAVILEVHFSLPDGSRNLPLEAVDWFLQQTDTVGQKKSAFNTLKAEAHLLYLCAHTILQHGEAEFRLQRYYDLHLLACTPEINWDKIMHSASELGWAHIVERALRLTHIYFDSPIPVDALASMRKHLPKNEAALRARRLSGAGHRWEGTLSSMFGYSLIQRLRWLFYLTFPPAAYMRARYATQPGRSLAPYYIYRWLDATKEIFSAGWRRLQ